MKASAIRKEWAPWLMLSPFLILFAIFIAYPTIQSVILSMQQTYGPEASRYIGWENFSFMLRDSLFWKALANTAIFAAGSVFIQLPCSLGLAMLLNRPSLRGRWLYRLLFFSPSLVGPVFVAMIFALIFEKRTGMLNVLLHWAFGLHDIAWLENFVMPALILAALWLYVGFNMVYFLAALQNVQQELIEAATIDGAGPWHRFIHVILPALRPVGTFVVLLSLIGSFQLFELPYLLLSGGGPNNEGLTLVMYLYETGFESGDMGYASAQGWMLAIILGLFAILQRFIGQKGEE